MREWGTAIVMCFCNRNPALAGGVIIGVWLTLKSSFRTHGLIF
jgi:hypothetical protein